MFLGLTNADTSFHAKKVSALEKKQVGYFFAEQEIIVTLKGK